MIYNYHDFVKVIHDVGFSMGGGADDGIYSYSHLCAPCIRAHTEDPDTDPWEWRIRVLDEGADIAYAKLFFKKSGYITKDWYPYFLAARRDGNTFEDAYARGVISHFAKRIYDVVAENGTVPLHNIKQLAGFKREDKSGFDRAITELQMGMFLTICGSQQKHFKIGGNTENNTGWRSTVFCTTETFFGEDVFNKAAKLSVNEAVDAIREQVLKLNPSAQEKKIIKFINPIG